MFLAAEKKPRVASMPSGTARVVGRGLKTTSRTAAARAQAPGLSSAMSLSNVFRSVKRPIASGPARFSVARTMWR